MREVTAFWKSSNFWSPGPGWRVLPSEAVLYRQVEAQFPTLLLDEIDTIFKPGVGDKYEGHRAILNAGHRQGLNVPRCFGPNQEVKAFRVFCPKVLAGIGSLPDTVADRSVPIRLVRRKRDEEVQRFFRRQAVPVAERLKERIEKWAEREVMKKLMVVAWISAAAVMCSAALGCGGDSSRKGQMPSAGQIEEAEKAVQTELPAIPLWERARFQGVATRDGDVCVDRILAKRSAELLGGSRASSHVIVAIPELTTGKPRDGGCEK